ncbi:diguanylate cyclase, partial [bacterium]|nr:diguanylate cyclase [bacterium]
MNLVSKIEESKKKRSLVVIAVTAVVIVLVVLCVLFIQLLMKKERLEIEGHIMEVAKQSAVATDILINGDFQTLNLFAHVLEQEPKYIDRQNVRPLLRAAINNTRFYSMGVAYPNGDVVIYDAEKGFVPIINVLDFKYFQEGMRGNKFLSFINSAYDEDKLIVLYEVPIIRNGKVIALLTGAHGAEDYNRAVDITAFNNEAVVHIIDGDGNLILRDSSPKTILKSSIFETDDVPNEQRIKALKSETPLSYWFKDVNNVKKVAAFVPIGYNNWKILAILPFNAITHNSNAVLRYAVIFFFVIGIIIILGIRYNIANRQRSDNMILDIALRDDVTHCLNKTSFGIEAEKILFNKKAELNEKLAVILMDIDNFKIVNEVYDIEKGDVVLKEISSILSKNVAENGLVARL